MHACLVAIRFSVATSQLLSVVFDKKLSKLPKKDVEKYLLGAVMDFMKKM